MKDTKSKKNKIKTLDVILVINTVLLIAFTVTMIITFWRYQDVPDTLIVAFFGVSTGEYGCTTYIWKSKLGIKSDNSVSDPELPESEISESED